MVLCYKGGNSYLTRDPKYITYKHLILFCCKTKTPYSLIKLVHQSHERKSVSKAFSVGTKAHPNIVVLLLSFLNKSRVENSKFYLEVNRRFGLVKTNTFLRGNY